MAASTSTSHHMVSHVFHTRANRVLIVLFPSLPNRPCPILYFWAGHVHTANHAHVLNSTTAVGCPTRPCISSHHTTTIFSEFMPHVTLLCLRNSCILGKHAYDHWRQLSTPTLAMNVGSHTLPGCTKLALFPRSAMLYTANDHEILFGPWIVDPHRLTCGFGRCPSMRLLNLS